MNPDLNVSSAVGPMAGLRAGWRRPRRSAGRLVRRLGLSVAVLAILLTGASAALADGGTSIASAPRVTNGQQEFGNTANGAVAGDCSWFTTVATDYASFWLLPVAAGDNLTIDWEGSGVVWAGLWPVGTNDFNVNDATTAEQDTLGSNGAQEDTLTATQDGVMPLEFDNCGGFRGVSPGPYDFTVHVHHGVVFSVPALTTLPLTGSLSVGVRNPDGVTITDPSLSVALQVQGGDGNWTTVGSAPAISGVANIKYSIANSLAGQQVSVQSATNGDASYSSQASSPQTVTLAARPVAPPKPPKQKLRALSLRHAGKAVIGQLRSRAVGVKITVSHQTRSGWITLLRLHSGKQGKFSYRLPRRFKGTLRFAAPGGSATITL
jgi:hypothetical protein